MIEQELGNLLPFERPFASILTMVEVDPADPAFADPTKFIGPVYEREEAERLAAEKGWADQAGRRQVAPRRRVARARSASSRSGPSGGCSSTARSSSAPAAAGIPTMYLPGTRTLVGAEVVIDKDRASALLAEQLEADLFVMATDVDAVYTRLRHAAAGGDRPHDAGRARGAASCRRGPWAPRWRPRSRSCAETGKRGRDRDAGRSCGGVVAGEQGTQIEPDAELSHGQPTPDDARSRPRRPSRRPARAAVARASRCWRSAILVVLISTTVLLFGTDATGGPLQVALMTSAVLAGLLSLRLGNRVADQRRGRRRRLVRHGARSSSCSRWAR